MKIIDTDNFDGDYPNEVIVADNITDPTKARIMCDALNEKLSGTYAPRFYKVVDDNYQLAPLFEP